MPIAQDIASIIANQVGEQLEEVEGMGMLSAADRKRVEDHYYKLCDPCSEKNYSTGQVFFYTMCGDRQIGSQVDEDEDRIGLCIDTMKRTKRNEESKLTVVLYIRIYSQNGCYPCFKTEYTGSDGDLRDWVGGAFDEVFAAMRSMAKCSACNRYNCDLVKKICMPCFMHARVKRARTCAD